MLVTSNNIEYAVNYEPGPNYGKWVVYNNWQGTNNNVRVKIGVRQYIYSLNGSNLRIFDVTDGTMRSCGAIIFPSRPTYQDKNNDKELTTDEIMNAELHADNVVKLSDDIWLDGSGKMWTITDIGMIVWNDENSDGVKQIEELKPYAKGAGTPLMLSPGIWIDNKGNWWVASWNNATVRADMEGLDKNNNPIYNFDNRKTVIPADDSKWGFRANNVRIDPVNGDIYRVGNSKIYSAKKGPGFWMGGAVVTRHKADGSLVSVYPIADQYCAVVIATDTDGQFYYQGFSSSDQHWVKVFTSDGLLAAECRMGGPSGDSGGWMDHGLSLTAFTHPITKVHYAYAEEVFWGKAIRYRIDGLNELNDPAQKRRGSGTFEWKP